jgi:transposase
MERRARQEGAPLSANTLAQSCGKLIDLFDPIVEHIFEQCVRSSYFAIDATSMPVLDITVPIGIRTGALWLLQGDHVYSYFLYAESGHAKHVEDKLVGRKLKSAMCDGSPTNNLVERAGATRGGCNAHARRKLVEALRCSDGRALGGIELYGELFHVEAESKREGESLAQRFVRRQEHSAFVVERLRRWVDERVDDVEPKSKLGQAVRYMRRQWGRLTEFLRDPLMELTNNEVERDLRTWVLNRKTWLFCGHDESARRAAAALSLITTCKKLGVEPRSYIRDTLQRIVSGEKSLAALLPENYKPKLPAAEQPEAVAA